MHRLIIFSLSFLLLFCTFYGLSRAENIGNIVVSIPIVVDGGKTQEGDIISKSDDGFLLARKFYDVNIYGVIVDEAPVELYSIDGEEDTYAVSAGQAVVRVSAKNGKININDVITSSDIPGVGVKALGSGYVLGRALESHEGEGLGVINVQLQPHLEGETEASKKNSWRQILLMLLAFFHF